MCKNQFLFSAQNFCISYYLILFENQWAHTSRELLYMSDTAFPQKLVGTGFFNVGQPTKNWLLTHSHFPQERLRMRDI